MMSITKSITGPDSRAEFVTDPLNVTLAFGNVSEPCPHYGHNHVYGMIFPAILHSQLMVT